jgi:ATP-binding cassette, subfamily A (ABC1), member 3
VVKEKELRQKELMKMMSVSESDINWSWFATFMLVHFFTATFAAMLSTSLYGKSDGFLLWVFWMLTMIAIVAFSMTIAALSSKAVRATLIGLLIFFAGYMLADVFSYEDRSLGLVQLISLHPVAAFSYGLDQIGSLEDKGVGLTSDSINFSENESGYKFRNTMTMLFVDCIVWGVLAWYFNRVIPPDYGQASPWYFPFTEFWSPGNVHGPVSDTSVATKIAHSGIPYEAVSDSLKRQAEEGKSIEIHNLRKVFGDKTAVDDLSLSIYRGQITALLGHNGKHVVFVWRSVQHHLFPSTDHLI